SRAALECLTPSPPIERGGLPAEAVTPLLAGARTVLRTLRGHVFGAQHAPALTITRTLTHGRVTGRGHGCCSGSGRCVARSTRLRFVGWRSRDWAGSSRPRSIGP